MKKQVLSLLFSLLPIMLWADAVEINGIYYNLISKGGMAEVTKNPNLYSGTIDIPESVTFEGITYSVTSIGYAAFYGCQDLTSIQIPNSVTSIGDEVFRNCSKLKAIVIPNSVSAISNYAFGECRGLTSITIPESVTSIGNSAFSACSGLTTLIIPNSVTSIGYSAFEHCSSLTSIIIPNSVKEIKSSVFWNCSSLVSVTISDSLTTIGDCAFKDCIGLSSVVIPNSVNYIDGKAFEGCVSLTTVTIGWNVNTIKNKAFASCKQLNDVFCFTEDVPSTTFNDSFDDSYIEYTTLHVRESAINSFKEKSPWKNFKEIVKMEIPKHKLTYMIDGEVYKAYELEEGMTIKTEANPWKEGYTFSGWSEIPIRMLEEDITVTGSFTINTYKLTYIVDNEGYKSYDVEYSANITPEPWPEKEGYTFSGWSEIPETMPACDVNVYGSFNFAQKCETPTIAYENGQLKFYCTTDGVNFVTNITDTDIKTHYDDVISLSATYIISVYAAKPDYANSDVAVATLCWIDTEPTMDGFSNGIANVRAQAVLIQNNDGSITINGVEDGTRVSAYTLNGIQVSSTNSQNGGAILNTNAKSGSTVIVKIGNKSVKVLLK